MFRSFCRLPFNELLWFFRVHPSFADSFLEFTDRSTISISGSVTIADTAPYNQGHGCPWSGVQVCAVDHIGAKSAFICKLTNARGIYTR